MSHSVVVTRTTTTTSSTAIILNTGILRTASGLLKLFETEYVCQTCGKTFCRKDNLQRHIKTHLNNDDETSSQSQTEMRPPQEEYACQTCAKKFSRKDALRRHQMVAKHGETSAGIIGAICLGLIAYYSTNRNGFSGNSEHTLFFIVTFAFLVTTFLLLISFLVSLLAASMLPKTIFEFLYHLFAFIFYMAASLAFLVYLSNYKRSEYYYEAKMAAAVLGLVNAVLYLLSTFFSFRSYRTA